MGPRPGRKGRKRARDDGTRAAKGIGAGSVSPGHEVRSPGGGRPGGAERTQHRRPLLRLRPTRALAATAGRAARPHAALPPVPPLPAVNKAARAGAGPAPGAAQHNPRAPFPSGQGAPSSLRSATTGSRLRRRLTSAAGGSCRSPGRCRLPQRGCGSPHTSERPWWEPVSDARHRHPPPALSRRRLSPPVPRRPGAALPPPPRPPPHWHAPPRPAPALTGAGAQHSHGPAPALPPRWLPSARPAPEAPPLHTPANREAARGQPSLRLAAPARFPLL